MNRFLFLRWIHWSSGRSQRNCHRWGRELKVGGYKEIQGRRAHQEVKETNVEARVEAIVTVIFLFKIIVYIFMHNCYCWYMKSMYITKMYIFTFYFFLSLIQWENRASVSELSIYKCWNYNFVIQVYSVQWVEFRTCWITDQIYNRSQ